ncbi:MAG: beta strand repeat-containing protein, partial [Acetobacteraceae bacterium]
MSGSLIDLGSNDDISNGGAFNDTILGGSGNDLIAGYGGNDSLLGGNDRDSINGGNGDDTILGESGNDLLLAGAGNDRLFGGDGDDTLGAEAPSDDGGSLLGTLTTASLYASYFNGGDGDDLFRVYDGNDTIIGGIGIDRVEFLSDNKTIALDNVSNDQASGIDHIILSGANQTLLLSAADVSRLTDSNILRVSGASGNDYNLTGGGWVQGASADGFTTFTNGAATVLIADNLVGGGGVPDASLVGTDGNDSTSLGVGSDSYLGLGGSDSILGNDGNDTIGGDDGADTIYGGSGNDSILGGNGNDRIFAEAGSDTVDAGAGNSDRILYNQNGGEAINAVITSSGGSSGVNTAIVTTATQGTDNLRGFELLSASSGNDSITVTTAATAIENLFVFGSAGDDTLVDNYRQNGVFADFLSSSVTSGVFVNLGMGVATDGLGGNDSLVGFTAVNATSFNDTLIGSNANDRFRPWQGNDSIDGGSGSGDILDYSQNSSSQVVSVNLSLGLANDGLGGTDTLVGIEQVRGGGGNDTIIGDGSDNNFRGNSGNDLLDGGAGAADVVDYSFASTGVSVNLGAGRASDGQLGTDTLANIE